MQRTRSTGRAEFWVWVTYVTCCVVAWPVWIAVLMHTGWGGLAGFLLLFPLVGVTGSLCVIACYAVLRMWHRALVIAVVSVLWVAIALAPANGGELAFLQAAMLCLMPLVPPASRLVTMPFELAGRFGGSSVPRRRQPGQ